MPHIPAITSIPNIPLPDSIQQPESSGGGDAFRSILQQSVASVSQVQGNAATAINQFLSGEQEDPQTMMMAVERSNLAFDMFVQIRNKVVSAYQEVMKMPD